MARFGVRSGSLPFARVHEDLANLRIERTDANGSERPLAFAMQKVVGSSPIIRSESTCKTAGAVAWKSNFPGLMAR
jgi:hypothetical protein